MRNLFLFIFLTPFYLVQGQEIDLSKWKKDSIPIGERLSQTNKSDAHWSFVIRDDSVHIVQNTYERILGDVLAFPMDSIKGIVKGKNYIKSIYNGYLIGEKGSYLSGGLYFVTLHNEYSYEVEEIIEDPEHIYGYTNKNILKIFEFHNKIYATRGYPYKGLNTGNIIEVVYDQGKWQYKNISKLIESPTISFVHGTFLYIITSQYVLKIDKDLIIKQILQSPFYWGALYPTSAFIKI